MSQSPPDRLDRIERILEVLAANQATEQQARSNLQAQIDQVAHQQATNTEAIGQLAQRVDGLTVEIHSLNATLMQSIENAETDREAFQAEIRRIWEYLLGQSGNGHTSSGG